MTEKFQSTLPHGERHTIGEDAKTLEGFNPRSRMGSDEAEIEKDNEALVSIHAPAWGATIKKKIRHKYWVVSIHAPAWGATKGTESMYGFAIVSIHAPAWGATT